MTFLNWKDVDPQRHPSPTTDTQRQELTRALTQLIAEHTPHITPFTPKQTQEMAFNRAVSTLLVERYGPWATTWAITRPPNRHTWCCVNHSLAPNDPHTSATRIINSLQLQRQWMEELATTFDELTPPPDLTPTQHTHHLQRVLTRLITMAVIRTQAEDAWQLECAWLLALFLSHQGLSEPHIHDEIDSLIEGRFDSWTTPTDSAITTVTDDIAHRFTPDLTPDEH